MNIDQLKQAIEISKLLNGESCITDFPEPVGEKVFIRTVTLYYTGQIKKICGQFITLEKAAWIPDTGRFNDFLKTGKANEVEPFEDDVHIPIGSLIDITKWKSKLPQEQK
jgi:hypothetical protein